ncbi:hypothetical protein FACS189430_08850 [Bacteroidia bacterium]|nr:hypothetical protein FACS189430_08850 [Bacteroidia bacterium]
MPSYIENKTNLSAGFPEASHFIDNLVNAQRRQQGFEIGTSINLHYYLKNKFLFRIEFGSGRELMFDFNRRKVPNREDKSAEFFSMLTQEVDNSASPNKRYFCNKRVIIHVGVKDYLDMVNQAINKFYAQYHSGTLNAAKATAQQPALQQESFDSEMTEIPAASATNIRKAAGFGGGYYQINREERNLMAMFYHTLLLGDNLKKFLSLIGNRDAVVPSEMGIYFEYAYIRDLWFNIEKSDNHRKRSLILDLLQPINRGELEKMSIGQFNRYFGCNSTDYIENPGNWRLAEYDKHIHDTAEFLKVCKFKWCFNAKPDMVIHTSHDKAVCIEGKFESGEGSYPAGKEEKAIFDRRGLERVGQLSIQQKVMELLGVKAQFVLLSAKGTDTDTHAAYSWGEVFAALDTSHCPDYIRESVRRF